MTLSDAKTAADRLAIEGNRTLVVWRMPRWPPEVYGVIAADRTPPEAIIAYTAELSTGRLF